MAAQHASDSLLAMPSPGAFVRFADAAPRFLVTVDTEEEFDWDAPFNRASRRVTAGEGLARAHDRFVRAGVRPLYMTDYPVIDDPVVGPMMANWVRDGSADIGAHCHPWVNPPHQEAVTVANSFAGNLPEPLERAKIVALRDRIAEVVGAPPVAFRAGRYGAGSNTGRILADLGFRLDSSVRSLFDYSDEGGPDYSRMPLAPYRTGPGGALLELPLSTARVGLLRRIGGRMGRGGAAGAATAWLARMRLLERIPMTPEGVGPRDAMLGMDRLLAERVPVLTFSFHSPSLVPGNTPYVRTQADLDAFHRWWDVVLAHLDRRGVRPTHVAEILSACQGG